MIGGTSLPYTWLVPVDAINEYIGDCVDMNKGCSSIDCACDADTVEYCQDNAKRWAKVFMNEWHRRGWSMVDQYSMTSWFANAIEHSCAYRIQTGMYTNCKGEVRSNA